MASGSVSDQSHIEAAPSPQAMVDQLVTLAMRHVGEQLTALVGSLSAALLDVTAPDEARVVYQRVKSGNLLKQNSYAFIHIAAEAIEQSLRREVILLTPTVSGAEESTLESMSLIPLAEMDSKVAFGLISRPFDIAHAEALATLNVRLAYLLDREILRGSQNPFRPDVFLTALDQAWCEFEPDSAAHVLIQPLLRPEILFDFDALYDALNLALKRNGRQPANAGKRQIRKTDGVAAAKAARASDRAVLAKQLRNFFDDGSASTKEIAVPLVPELPNMPQGAGGWRPSTAGEFVVAPAVAYPAGVLPVDGQSGSKSGQFAAVPTDAVQPHGSSRQDHVQAALREEDAHRPLRTHNALPESAATMAAGIGGVPHHTGPAAHSQPAHAQAVAMPALMSTSTPRAGFGAGVSTSLPQFLGPAAATGDDTRDASSLAGLGPRTGALGQYDVSGDAIASAGAMPHAPAQPGATVAMPAHVATVAVPAHVATVAVPAHVAPLLELLARLPDLPPAPPHAAGAATALGAGETEGTAPAAPQNVFYLPRLKQSLPRGSLSRGDEHTLDLLSRIFETVYLDESIPAPTRELIQSLQMPVLKAALLDKNFFFEDAHPARRMIDLLSRMGWDQRSNADDPVFQAMQRTIARVERDGAQQPQAFAAAVAELEQSMAADEQALQLALAEPVALALRQEHTVLARRAANDAIALRLGGDDVVPVVGTFLKNKWLDVLTLAYGVEEKKPGAVSNATRAMDDLVWSVKPKATHEQRKTLIARLPSLLTTINKWLDIIKWRDAERLQFFAALAECHATIVRAPIDLSPERQLELAVEAAQHDAMRLVAQEHAAAERAELAAGDAVTQTVEGLERGRWIEFTQADGSLRKVKLAWVSPRRTLFIFSTGARQEAFSMPAEQLIRAVRDGKAAILTLEGVVGRVLSEAMLDAAGNDDSAHAAA